MGGQSPDRVGGGQVTDKGWAPGPVRQKGGLVDGWVDLCWNRCADEGTEPRQMDIDVGVGASQIKIEKWVGWQTRWMGRQIGCEVQQSWIWV